MLRRVRALRVMLHAQGPHHSEAASHHHRVPSQPCSLMRALCSLHLAVWLCAPLKQHCIVVRFRIRRKTSKQSSAWEIALRPATGAACSSSAGAAVSSQSLPVVPTAHSLKLSSLHHPTYSPTPPSICLTVCLSGCLPIRPVSPSSHLSKS